MGVFDRLKTLIGKSDDAEIASQQFEQVDVDHETGQPVYKNDVVTFIKEEFDRRKRERYPLELKWRLIANFIAGNQYINIDPEAQEIYDEQSVYNWTAREVYNRLAPIYETRLAKLGRVKPSMKVRPATSELGDVSKAKISENLLRGTQINTGFSEKLSFANAFSDMLGSVFWMSWWNTEKGRKIGEETKISIDEEGSEKPPEIINIHEGDLDYCVLSPFEVYPDSIMTADVETAKSILVVQAKTAKEIYDLYGVRLKGTAVDTFSITPIGTFDGYGYDGGSSTISIQQQDDSLYVYTYFERPSRDYKNGRMIIVVGDDYLHYYGDLIYKVDGNAEPEPGIPIVRQVSVQNPGCFFGTSVYDRLISPQRKYNAIKNQKHDYLARLMIGVFQVEEGDGVDIEDLTENGVPPGKIIPIKPGSSGLSPINIAPLPNDVYREEEELQREIEYLSGVSEMAITSNVPSGVTSGKAMEAIKDSDDTRLSVSAENIRFATVKLAKQWLKIYKQFSTGARVLEYVGNNEIANVMAWDKNDITSYDVVYDTEVELLDSLSSRRETLMEFIQMGVLTDENGRISEATKAKIMEVAKLGNVDDMKTIDVFHRERAKREVAYLDFGVFPEIADYDNHMIHLEEHMKFILQTDFEVMMQENKKNADMMLSHIEAHKQAIEQLQTQEIQKQMAMQQQMQAPQKQEG